MKLEQWQQIEDLFHAALERPAEHRAAFVVEACEGDAALQAEVVSLLTAHEEADQSTLDLPAQAVQHAALHLAAEKPARPPLSCRVTTSRVRPASRSARVSPTQTIGVRPF